MRLAQKSMADFLHLIDWQQFRRTNWSDRIGVSNKGLVVFGCGDEQQALWYLLRRDNIGKNGMLQTNAAPASGCVHLPLHVPGQYRVTAWDTRAGKPLANLELTHTGGRDLCVSLPPIHTDMAFALVRC
jgi:mannan endo-1,4-beta-mannosidase